MFCLNENNIYHLYTQGIDIYLVCRGKVLQTSSKNVSSVGQNYSP
mgnify:FL=1